MVENTTGEQTARTHNDNDGWLVGPGNSGGDEGGSRLAAQALFFQHAMEAADGHAALRAQERDGGEAAAMDEEREGAEQGAQGGQAMGEEPIKP